MQDPLLTNVSIAMDNNEKLLYLQYTFKMGFNLESFY